MPIKSMLTRSGRRQMPQRMPRRLCPSATSARASNGSGGTRHSQANRSNIGTSRARRSSKLPIAKVTGEINNTAKAPTLKSKPTVPEIIKSPIAAIADAGHLHARWALAKSQRRKRHREQRLALHDHAGEPDRHAVRDGPGLRQKLTEKQRAADGDQHSPGNLRAADKQARQRRDGKAQRRHQRRREFIECEAAGHEPQTPDDCHQDSEQTSAGFIVLFSPLMT